MPLYGRSTWWQRVQNSEAIRHFERDANGPFPLAELQKLAENRLKQATSAGSSLLHLRRRRVEKFSIDCDMLFSSELIQSKNTFPAREFAVVSCIHLLSDSKARQLLESIKPDVLQQDESLDKRLLVYLKCLIQAKKARANHCLPPIVSTHESVAATELLGIVNSQYATNNNQFPAVWRLLLALGKMNGTHTDLLPDGLVRTILRRCHFEERLDAELSLLLDLKAWYEALNIVVGLCGVLKTENQTIIDLAKDILPKHVMWAVWRPNQDRIKLWNQPSVAKYRTSLSPVLALEGPDTKGGQKQTLRASSSGGFFKLFGSAPATGKFNLDRLLDGLDNSIKIGPESIELFLHLCVEPGVGEVRLRELEQLEAALELHDDFTSKVLKDYLRLFQVAESAWSDRMMAITAVLPILDRNVQLQALYGTNLDLAQRAIQTLVDTQTELLARLLDGRPSEVFGLDVQAFGSALLQSEWLLRDHPGVIHHLQRIPSVKDVKIAFRSLDTLQGPRREAQIFFLKTTLCGSSERRHQAPSAAQAASHKDPIWHETMETSCDMLRRALRRTYRSNAHLATECLQQAQNEHELIVQEIADNISADTDMACFKIVNYLGARVAKGVAIHQCWKDLVLYMMRKRPAGLLERCAAELQPMSWFSWHTNLRRVFGGYHLTPQAGLGFSAEKIQALTAMMMKSRKEMSQSVNTGSTEGSTGWCSARSHQSCGSDDIQPYNLKGTYASTPFAKGSCPINNEDAERLGKTHITTVHEISQT